MLLEDDMAVTDVPTVRVSLPLDLEKQPVGFSNAAGLTAQRKAGTD